MILPTNMSTNMAGIFALILIGVIAFLFWKLRNITWYSVAIYGFLLTFWFTMTVARTSVDLGDRSQLPIWAWPVIVGCYQFMQAITRVPLGMLSSKVKSRQVPILITTSTILLSIIFMIATNFALWTLIFATIAAGFFGATYGIQNQYWSENYDKRAVFITVSLITILPSLAFLASSYTKNAIEINFGVAELKWLLVAIIGFLALAMILNVIFKERRETIQLDTEHRNHKHITKMKMRQVLSISISVVFVSISYNMVNGSTGSQQDEISEKVNLESILLTVIAIAIALFTALFLIHHTKSYNLVVIGHLLQMIGFLLALIYVFQVHSDALKWAYLITMVVGFTIFQNTLLGVTLHFDHKNTLFVLSIWLSFRSAATGLGQVVGQEAKVYNPDSMKWLIIAATALIAISLLFSIYNYFAHHKRLFTLVDKYEKASWKNTWRVANYKVVGK